MESRQRRILYSSANPFYRLLIHPHDQVPLSSKLGAHLKHSMTFNKLHLVVIMLIQYLNKMDKIKKS